MLHLLGTMFSAVDRPVKMNSVHLLKDCTLNMFELPVLNLIISIF